MRHHLTHQIVQQPPPPQVSTSSGTKLVKVGRRYSTCVPFISLTTTVSLDPPGTEPSETSAIETHFVPQMLEFTDNTTKIKSKKSTGRRRGWGKIFVGSQTKEDESQPPDHKLGRKSEWYGFAFHWAKSWTGIF